jgi:quinohemoprotein ethanol dehydrogenase
MQPGTHEVFNQVVRDGLLLPNGMPRWDDLLSVEDVDAIHAWLIAEQGPLRERELKLKAAGKPIDAPSAAIMSNF